MSFTEGRYESVVRLLSGKPNAKVVQGFFPGAAKDLPIQNVAFCHLDVDVYGATLESLEYLAPRLARKSLVVIDDVRREHRGG